MKNREVIGRQRCWWVWAIVSGERGREDKGADGGVLVRTDGVDAVERVRLGVTDLEKMWIGGTELEVAALQWFRLVVGANEKSPGSRKRKVGFGGKCGITGVFEPIEQKAAKGAKRLGIVA